MNSTLYDVVIVGGSYAGLSAAMTLGRSLRNGLVIDSGLPCNRQTPHSHNLITHDGRTPGEIARIAREQVLAYPTVSFLTDKVITARREEDTFVLATENGVELSARKVLLATGVVDEMPDLDGFAPCWGVSILHCPYCHGYEVRGRKLGLLANGDTGYELTKLIQHWSRELVLLTNGPATFTDEQRDLIARLQVPVVESPVSRIDHENGQLRSVVFADGSRQPLDAMFTRLPIRQHHTLAEQLGCGLSTVPFPGLIEADEFGKTTVPGVYVAGDNSSPMRSVGVAISKGIMAAAWINRELIEEDLVRSSRVFTGLAEKS
ncbi:NAD(P)/FAD-dependent oxidoreductase [Tellurirhabdus rosea]|uniref:NAD(P)/FAD-dependent oxidoreductase n=1 Tax=Tellurirhabdus rosea TaxID=2674997 RepID=UPI00224CABA7|nr:NAD(P)/FAD-dependent oxidoreductase [Tellurirhabdus rosea]